MFNWNELPLEIQDLVLDKIMDTHIMCQARLVCHRWRNFWSKIPCYEKEIKIGYFVLKPTHFWLEDLGGIIMREIKFKSYGRWCYQEFTPTGQIFRKIENKTFFMTENTDNSQKYFKIIRKVDARGGSINEIKIPKIVHVPQCIIS